MPDIFENDSYLHKGLRQRLVLSLRDKGIHSEEVLQAMLRVPRHFFMAKGFEERAYQDNAFPIAAEQTISQPYTVAFQTQLLEIKKSEKILEVGTGSGYQTAILLELGARVYTIERQRELYLSSHKLLLSMKYSPYSYYGDGYEGLPTYSPFDKILITAGAEHVPEKLIAQLKPGGILVAPIGERDCQKMLRIRKNSEGNLITEDHGNFIFVPMLKGKN
jgi:protein-L-isoaspartate(D-aspartate) O-methyltransferase